MTKVAKTLCSCLTATLAAAALVAIASPDAALAGSVKKPSTTMQQPNVLAPALTAFCADPAPVSMKFGKAYVVGKPDLFVITATGTVQNVGTAEYDHDHQPSWDMVEVRIQWGGKGGQFKTGEGLLTLAPGATQTIRAAEASTVYLKRLAEYGAPPMFILKITTSGGSQDCKQGNDNIRYFEGPSASQLLAMGFQS